MRVACTVSLAVAAVLVSTLQVSAADLDGDNERLEQRWDPHPHWSFNFTTYGWLTWMSGDGELNGREFDIKATPKQIIDHLDWSGLPAWMSYAEARYGKLGLFNDIVYAKLKGSANLARAVRRGPLAATFGADVNADFEQAVIELGGAYEVTKWHANETYGHSAWTAFDVLLGARYWRQDATVSADLATTLAAGGPAGITISGNRAIAKSGSVDWVDPFVGMRWRHHLSPGQEVVVRGDVGGFGIGSALSWHALATYSARLGSSHGITIDGYVGYKALSVDYATGSGTSSYEFNAVQHGPVIGMTARF